MAENHATMSMKLVSAKVSYLVQNIAVIGQQALKAEGYFQPLNILKMQYLFMRSWAAGFVWCLGFWIICDASWDIYAGKAAT